MDVGYYNSIINMSISKNNKYLLTTSGDFTAKLVDISSKIVIKTFTGHTKSINCAIFGNGDDVFTASNDKTIKRWNILSGDNGSNDIGFNKCVYTYYGHKKCVKCVILDEINNRIFSSSWDSKIIRWDVDTGEKMSIMSGHTNVVHSICFVNPNTIASASADKSIKLWNITTFECIKTLKSHTDWVRSVVTAPDGLHILSGGDDCTVKIWDIRTGKCLDSLKYHDSNIHKVVVSSDGKHIISGRMSRDYSGELVIAQVSPFFTYIVYKLNNITLLSDGILRDNNKIIYQIKSNDIITSINKYSLQIGNETFTTITREAQALIEYIKAVQLQLTLPLHERDDKYNIINRYRFEILQIINHNKKDISKRVMKIIGNYSLI